MFGIVSGEPSKNLEYNHATPIDLDSISDDKREQALKEFAEGSKALENCLKVMWNNNLKTRACCSGHNDEYKEAYIAMDEGVDVFSYLSEEVLLNDMIVLEFIGSYQTIRFAGSNELKEKLMQKVTDDILKGKKANKEQVENKIGKTFNAEWLKERRIYFMRQSGLSDDEIKQNERDLEIRRIMEVGTEEEQDAIYPEFVEYVKRVNQRLLEREEKIHKK